MLPLNSGPTCVLKYCQCYITHDYSYISKKGQNISFDEKISLPLWKKISQFPYIISIGKCAKSLIESSNFDTSIIRVKDFVTLRPHTLLLRPPWQKSQSRWPCSAYLRQQPFTLFSWIFFYIYFLPIFCINFWANCCRTTKRRTSWRTPPRG